MDIKRNGSRASGRQPAANFTGSARSDPLFEVGAPPRMRAATVTFEPGSRTNWHTHPLGQILIITAGTGLVQTWGGEIQRVNPGDVVWFEAGEKHWHGALPTTFMVHIAIAEQKDGKAADWLEPVSEAQYGAFKD